MVYKVQEERLPEGVTIRFTGRGERRASSWRPILISNGLETSEKRHDLFFFDTELERREIVSLNLIFS